MANDGIDGDGGQATVSNDLLALGFCQGCIGLFSLSLSRFAFFAALPPFS